MSYLTDRKRAVGMGSAKTGTHHHWATTVSAAGLLILVPLFIFTFGSQLGEPHADVVAYYSRPFPSIVAALTILIGSMHFKSGVQTLLEDYVPGKARIISIIIMICVSYGAAATGLFALVKLAL